MGFVASEKCWYKINKLYLNYAFYQATGGKYVPQPVLLLSTAVDYNMDTTSHKI